MDKDFKLGGLSLDPKEQRLYLIIKEALKESELHTDVDDLKCVVYGKDGNNGLRGTVAKLKGGFYVLTSMTIAIILFILGLNVVY